MVEELQVGAKARPLPQTPPALGRGSSLVVTSPGSSRDRLMENPLIYVMELFDATSGAAGARVFAVRVWLQRWIL